MSISTATNNPIGFFDSGVGGLTVYSKFREKFPNEKCLYFGDTAHLPTKGHPVFTAQHATATCCRGCISKWHKLPKGVELTQTQQEYLVNIIMEWIKRQQA